MSAQEDQPRIANADEIVITPQMLEAGWAAFAEFDPGRDSTMKIVEAVYRAMELEKVRCDCGQQPRVK